MLFFSETEQFHSNFGTKPYTYVRVAKNSCVEDTVFLTKDALLSTSFLPNLVAYYIFSMLENPPFCLFNSNKLAALFFIVCSPLKAGSRDV